MRRMNASGVRKPQDKRSDVGSPEGRKGEAWASSCGFPLRRWSRSVSSRCWKTCTRTSRHPCMGVHMRPRWGEPRGDRPFLVVWRPEEAVPLILSVLSPYCSCLVGTLLAANASGWLLGRKAALQNPPPQPPPQALGFAGDSPPRLWANSHIQSYLAPPQLASHRPSGELDCPSPR